VRWPSTSAVGHALATGEARLSVLRDVAASPTPVTVDGTEMRVTGPVQTMAAPTDETRWARRAGASTVAAAPIVRHGRPVGVVTLTALAERAPLTEVDLVLAGELAARAAEAIDRAELAAASAPDASARRRAAPQRSLTTAGLAVLARHRPGESDRLWDWYDVVDLGAGRVALVIGNIVGGELAAASLESLRSSVRACARLDLPPHEVITLLDGVLADLGQEHQLAGAAGQLATCIYAIVETDSGRVSLASAGHPPPLVVAPDGLVSRLYMEVGPPLGARRDDVKEYAVRLGPNWLLALFTDGLVATRGRELDTGVSQLAGALARPGAPLAELADEAFAALPADAGLGEDAGLTVDGALLVARLPAESAAAASVEIPVDGGAPDVAVARTAARAVLAEWALPAEALETTVLVLSELLGNAVAHGRAPIDARVRRLADRVVVEVADGGGRLPRRRHAGSDEEAGRGLELVATLANRWGARPTADGKVVWAEIGPTAPPA
jgi:anti-sigma regulatory factor (Ser/Thr protein kinase)